MFVEVEQMQLVLSTNFFDAEHLPERLPVIRKAGFDQPDKQQNCPLRRWRGGFEKSIRLDLTPF